MHHNQHHHRHHHHYHNYHRYDHFQQHQHLNNNHHYFYHQHDHLRMASLLPPDGGSPLDLQGEVHFSIITEFVSQENTFHCNENV